MIPAYDFGPVGEGVTFLPSKGKRERGVMCQEKVIPDACAAKANTVGQGDTAG